MRKKKKAQAHAQQQRGVRSGAGVDHGESPEVATLQF
jgi:hypothetical protein